MCFICVGLRSDSVFEELAGSIEALWSKIKACINSMCVHVCAFVSTQGSPGERGERGEPGDEGYQVGETIKSTSDIPHSHHSGCLSVCLLFTLFRCSIERLLYLDKGKPCMSKRITYFPGISLWKSGVSETSCLTDICYTHTHAHGLNSHTCIVPMSWFMSSTDLTFGVYYLQIYIDT